MSELGSAFGAALRLLLTADPDVMAAVRATVSFSLASATLASLLGVPAGAVLALVPFRGRGLLVAAADSLLAVPTVVVGLAVYAALSRQGPLGDLGLLFTPWAVVAGQTLLILPIVVSLSRSAIAAVDPLYAETARTLGAGPWRSAAAVLREARPGVQGACGTALGRAIGEVGVSMMLGGNIAGFTRTMTTVIALETSKGEFELALALGIALLAAAFAVNAAVRATRPGPP